MMENNNTSVYTSETPKIPTWDTLLIYITPLLLAYPLLTSLLRFRRHHNLHKRYHFPTRDSFSRMTDDQAWEIQKVLAQLEFPFIYIKALQFALFRTYGIPSISTVLTKTTQFSQPATSLKRYSDTSALIQEFIAHSPSSQRAYTSLARTRFLHAAYRASGTIREDDMLYTLDLFAIQPIRFIERFEWRGLSDLEKCAIGTFWKSVGDALGIDYKPLPSGRTGFKDGLHWLEEITTWSDAYEKRCMAPHIKNRETADQTTAVLVYMLPKCLHHVGLKFVSFMMDERLRRAMLYDAPPPLYTTIFSTLLNTRRFILRYLTPPRPYFMRHMSLSETPGEDNRIFMTQWDAAPYYVKPSLWNRWSPTAWVTWVLGRPLPGDEGERYYPRGYRIEDVGPRYFEGRGGKSMEGFVKEYKMARTGGCPFH